MESLDIQMIRADLFRELSEGNDSVRDCVIECNQFAINNSLDEPRLEDDSTVLCAFTEGDKALGFLNYYVEYNLELGKSQLYIAWIYVRPMYRRSGVYKQLLKCLKFIAQLHGIDRIVAYVLNDNEDSIKAHEALGFIKEDIRIRDMEDWEADRFSSYEFKVGGN